MSSMAKREVIGLGRDTVPLPFLVTFLCSCACASDLFLIRFSRVDLVLVFPERLFNLKFRNCSEMA
jgi:hypothetical protein